MTAPLCIACNLVPVKRNYPSNVRRIKMAPRIIDGQYWHWYCGRACATRHSLSQQEAWKTRVRNRQQKHVAQVVALVKDHMDENGKVPAKLFTSEIVKALKRAYNAGYNAAMWPRTQEVYSRAS